MPVVEESSLIELISTGMENCRFMGTPVGVDGVCAGDTEFWLTNIGDVLRFLGMGGLL